MFIYLSFVFLLSENAFQELTVQSNLGIVPMFVELVYTKEFPFPDFNGRQMREGLTYFMDGHCVIT